MPTRDLNAGSKNIDQSAYPLAGASSGVYLPYTLNPSTGVAAFSGGGIYVQGDASVQLSATGASGPVYTITQGGTTTTITIDNTANTTTVASGGTTLNIMAVPTQLDPTSGPVTCDVLSPPVTTTQNQIPGTPADTLIPGSDFGQVLAIFTSTGDIQMNNQQADGPGN